MISNRLKIYSIFKQKKFWSMANNRSKWTSDGKPVDGAASDAFYREVYVEALKKTSIDREEIKRHLLAIRDNESAIAREYEDYEEQDRKETMEAGYYDSVDELLDKVDKTNRLSIAEGLARCVKNHLLDYDIDQLIVKAKQIYQGSNNISDGEWKVAIISQCRKYFRIK